MSRPNHRNGAEKRPLKKILWRWGATANKWIERLSGVLDVFMVLAILFVCAQAFAFCVVYFQLRSGPDALNVNILLFKFINIWGILPGKDVTNDFIRENFDSVKSNIEFQVNILIAIIGGIMSLFTLFSYFRQTVRLRRKSCFKKKGIFTDGVDDIKIMLEFYRRADFVAIYSYSFSWIPGNADIKKVLEDLAKNGKLKLRTGNKPEDVRDSLRSQRCSEELLACLGHSGITLDRDKPVRFSYIERDSAKYVLYRHEDPDDENTYVVTVRRNDESEYLLDVISHLIRRQEPHTEAQSNDQSRN